MTVAFAEHAALLARFLDRRGDIAESIEGRLLNVRGKDAARTRNRAYFERAFAACFFGAPDLPRDLVRLQGQLAAAHLADGFEPVQVDARLQALDPLELIVRAYQHWEQGRWPGKAVRLTYAASLFSAFMLRQLNSSV